MDLTKTYGGRVAIVAGGSEGIGLATSIALARSGASVAILARSESKLEHAVTLLEAERQSSAQSFGIRSVDVCDAGATRRAVDAVVAELGAPAYVLSFAGFARPGWFDDTSTTWVHQMMDVNFFGTYNVCQAAVPHLVANGGGHILTTASMAGLLGVFGYTGYCATKFAVIGFSEALRRELRPSGVSVTVLCPPNTRTPGFDEENRHKPPEVLAAEESVRTLAPEVVAATVIDRLPAGPALIIPSRDARVAYRLNRWMPVLVDRALRRPT